jgi:ionotropic glutamate receptor
MLTVQQLQPTVTDIHDLIKNGDYVGYHRGSFVEGLLQQLGFDKTKMKAYPREEFAEALDKGSANGGVTAIVHTIPYIKLFLAKNCKSYTMVGPIYKTAGFGFVSLTLIIHIHMPDTNCINMFTHTKSSFQHDNNNL